MTREVLIKKTMEHLAKLPDNKLQEVSDFAEFLLGRMDDQLLIEGIQKMVTSSEAFRFLEDEPEMYTSADLKEQYK